MGPIPSSSTVEPLVQGESLARALPQNAFEESGKRPADFRARFEQEASFVRQVLARLGVPRADRDDLLQEVFVVVCRKLDGYDGRSPFRSWLYGICLRTVSTYRRSAQVRHQGSGENCAVDDFESHIASNPEHNAEFRRIWNDLEGLLVRLEDDKREVFVLFALEGLPMTKVAEIVGCPLQTAYSRLQAARRAIRELL